jgi:hypothetical protein
MRLRWIAKRDIPTTGVGDGGNEIGMGAIREAVHEFVPHGKVLCAKLAMIFYCRPVFLTGAVTRFKRRSPSLAHAPALEKHLIESAAAAGLVDGNRASAKRPLTAGGGR